MGTFSTDAQKVIFNVKSTFGGIADSLQDAFQSVVGRVGATAAGLLNGDVVGINGAEIPNMQTAIRNYIDELQRHLDTVKTNTSTTNAFKGQYAMAVTEFVNAVCDACGCVISNLLEFNQRLDEVYAAYQAKDEQMASDIKAQGAELNSRFQRYTETN